ncbi:acyltransferase [Pedobacter frigiditerrae]|uniref:acyltransferase n=1 Tax=Pedobacter frigiditerrae TaxID=2530452 RepID=UPI00292EDA64|nr:acyltransferase [Pedobacter frigiditerrae]
MASLSYLITNRAKFGIGSLKFWKSWAKRALTLSEVVRRNHMRRKLIRAGAIISEIAEIGSPKIDGDKRNLKIGAYSFIGNAILALHTEISIGERVCINDGVNLLSASHDLTDPEWKLKKGAIVIDDYAWICTNAIVLPGVHIGRGAVVGAGAVVSKNVGAGEIVAGNPAKPINKKRALDLNYNPCEFLAGNRAWLIG